MSKYEESVKNRTAIKYYTGILIRWKQNLYYSYIRKVARRKGAVIGEGVVMPLAQAKQANANLVVGNHVSIQTSDIDLRSPVHIGNNVIKKQEKK